MTILITGGAGFIGCNFAKLWLRGDKEKIIGEKIINIDKLSYAGHRENFADEAGNPHYEFVRADIGDETEILRILQKETPRAVINFAAESHVDRAVAGGDAFIDNNITATYNLLKSTYAYWQTLSPKAQAAFRFMQISTDEVYGSLDFESPAFTESTAQAPSSLYSASKAAADNLVHAYYKTYGLPVMITHTTNNYGPYQFPEKLIPLIIVKALAEEALPIYGDGKNIRDWIHVEDNCRALMMLLDKGQTGETYNIGGQNETDNLSLVHILCELLDEASPRADKKPYSEQITFIADRPGHDLRYAIDISKIHRQFGWQPQYDLRQGLKETVAWYLSHRDWLAAVGGEAYSNWEVVHYEDSSARR